MGNPCVSQTFENQNKMPCSQAGPTYLPTISIKRLSPPLNINNAGLYYPLLDTDKFSPLILFLLNNEYSGHFPTALFLLHTTPLILFCCAGNLSNNRGMIT